MSERNLNSKRESRELQASSTSVSPLQKKKKLDDSSADSHAVVLAILSFRSFNASSESNETVRNNPSSGVDLEVKLLESVALLGFALKRYELLEVRTLNIYNTVVPLATVTASVTSEPCG
ncbi:hypothetical protein Bca52824_025968 [Brassica carinata]|uniref:Uncharacterized protein n=1 Tax=Brassica carinata TaxID=52824 RepID=A0A8X7SIW7_BRACI|nr:hypothetical protein Bca52824_025968 [Brassica carinata]